MKLLNHSALLILQISLLFFLFSNCQSKNNGLNPSEIEPVSYLALGDSYTIGTGIDVEESWPMQLSDLLKDNNLTVRNTKIIATNGWTTTDLKEGIQDENPDSSYNMVSLLIGVNNQYQGLDIELYKTEFRELLEQSIAFANGDTGKVFVVSIPNYGITPFGKLRNTEKVTREIASYNEIAKNISTEYGIPFVNITPISEMAENDRDLLASDNLHPSAEMYGMWVEKIMPTVTQILQNHE
ncbi:MAG TPA: SGNH/GDSL hydrolase family protein [Gracilimonas sp.]|uniref:SGNH/GDSL hydrolase family protein n=1 Tax=Gracilimonas sp. TaxID=1974203 RepID=UPI002D9A082E|nr:SGNH/GDSL hydrolase family protein [Gracilimonas sp.]